MIELSKKKSIHVQVKMRLNYSAIALFVTDGLFILLTACKNQPSSNNQPEKPERDLSGRNEAAYNGIRNILFNI